DGTDVYLRVFDTTNDEFEVNTSSTAGNAATKYLALEIAGAGAGDLTILGSMDIASGKTYQINGTQIDIGDLGAGGNWTPTGTISFASATLENIGSGTVTSGDNYTTISNDVTDDTPDELFDAINTWAAGVGAGTLAALSDTSIGAYTGGHILIGDNSNSYDNKAVSGAITLAADGTTTLAANSTIATSLAIGADPADAEEIRLPVGGAIAWEDGGTEVTLTHVNTEGLLLNGTKQLQFRDAALNISSADDGHLDFAADVSVDFDAPLGVFTGDIRVAGLDIMVDNTEEVISLVDVATAVNEIEVTNAANGNPPIIAVSGGDENTDLKLAGKGTGKAKTYTELQIPVIAWTTDATVADGHFYFHIGKELAGMNLVYVHGEVITAGVTGTLNIDLRNVTQTGDILSTNLTIDTTETGSDTAAAAAVIDAAEDDMQENDLIAIDIDAIHSGTASKGLIVTLGFELP
ncbi:MAG: autotransporter outer membrane beta-barrel domain-containing protein, partial [Planctomycetota bacterium]